jgi:hypothetical protein
MGDNVLDIATERSLVPGNPGVCERAWGYLIQNQDFLDDEALRTLGFDLQSARDL